MPNCASTDYCIGVGLRQPHYKAVLSTQPKLGFFEVHSENFFGRGGAALQVLEQIRQHYEVSLHGVGLSLGSATGIDNAHLDQLALLCKRINPIRVSDHACFALGQTASQKVHAADLLPIPWTAESLEMMCNNIDQVQDRLARPIAVENLSAYISYPQSEIAETEFLNMLARRTGCKLFIDVNNIYVNAQNQVRQGGYGQNSLDICRHWIDQIDTDAVDEIHLAGHSDHLELVIDDHSTVVSPAVWQLYEHALNRFGATPTLVEWDTDIPSWQTLYQEALHAQSILTRYVSQAIAV